MKTACECVCVCMSVCVCVYVKAYLPHHLNVHPGDGQNRRRAKGRRAHGGVVLLRHRLAFAAYGCGCVYVVCEYMCEYSV
jgi:hypothetical protein